MEGYVAHCYYGDSFDLIDWLDDEDENICFATPLQAIFDQMNLKADANLISDQVGNNGDGDVFVFRSTTDLSYVAFDLFRGWTDQIGIISVTICHREEYTKTVTTNLDELLKDNAYFQRYATTSAQTLDEFLQKYPYLIHDEWLEKTYGVKAKYIQNAHVFPE